MKGISHIILFLFITCVPAACYSQTGNDTITLLNGDVIISNVIDTANGTVSIKNPKNAKRNIVIENDRIFSIKNSSGENVIYAYDTTIGNEFTIEEMRYFIYGEQDAAKGFKPRGAFYCNLAIGLASGLTGAFISPIPPFAFAALVGMPKVKIKPETVSNPEYLNQKPYLMGYERVARSKRKLKSLVSGGIGLATGLTTYLILKNNGIELIE